MTASIKETIGIPVGVYKYAWSPFPLSGSYSLFNRHNEKNLLMSADRKKKIKNSTSNYIDKDNLRI